jgi:hypothetical protein
MLTVPTTSVQSDSNTPPAWSKESIVALATIFIMILLSFLGMFWKYSVRTWAVIRRPHSLGMVREGTDQASIIAT